MGYGLFELHNPNDASVDVVLIHGLHGNEVRTWTYGSGQKSVFWPQELLPSDIGDARILSFGYDANIAHVWARPSENRLDSYSDDFFQQLDNNRHRIGAVCLNVSFRFECFARLPSRNSIILLSSHRLPCHSLNTSLFIHYLFPILPSFDSLLHTFRYMWYDFAGKAP